MIKTIYEAPALDLVQFFPLAVLAQSPNEVEGDVSSLNSDNSDNDFFNF